MRPSPSRSALNSWNSTASPGSRPSTPHGFGGAVVATVSETTTLTTAAGAVVVVAKSPDAGPSMVVGAVVDAAMVDGTVADTTASSPPHPASRPG